MTGCTERWTYAFARPEDARIFAETAFERAQGTRRLGPLVTTDWPPRASGVVWWPLMQAGAVGGYACWPEAS